MNFFEELFAISDNLDLNMQIKRKNDRLTISLKPGVQEANILPIIITGTPEELAGGFMEKIRKPMQEAGIIVANIQGMNDALKALEKEKQQKVGDKQAAASKDKKDEKSQSTDKKADTKKTVKKEEDKVDDSPKEMSIF